MNLRTAPPAAACNDTPQMMKNAAGGGLADGAEHMIMGGNQKSIEHHVAASASRSAKQETNYAPEGSMIQTGYKDSNVNRSCSFLSTDSDFSR